MTMTINDVKLPKSYTLLSNKVVTTPCNKNTDMISLDWVLATHSDNPSKPILRVCTKFYGHLSYYVSTIKEAVEQGQGIMLDSGFNYSLSIGAKELKELIGSFEL